MILRNNKEVFGEKLLQWASTSLDWTVVTIRWSWVIRFHNEPWRLLSLCPNVSTFVDLRRLQLKITKRRVWEGVNATATAQQQHGQRRRTFSNKKTAAATMRTACSCVRIGRRPANKQTRVYASSAIVTSMWAPEVGRTTHEKNQPEKETKKEHKPHRKLAKKSSKKRSYHTKRSTLRMFDARTRSILVSYTLLWAAAPTRTLGVPH